jgi:hypothetical protein
MKGCAIMRNKIDRNCVLKETESAFYFETGEQNMYFHNFSDEAKQLKINDKKITLEAHSGMNIVVPENLPENDRKELFDDTWLDEEEFEISGARLPY